MRSQTGCHVATLSGATFFLLFSLTNLSKTELFVPELHILNQKQISTRNCDMKPVSSYTSVSKFQNAFLYKLAKYQEIIVFLSIKFFRSQEFQSIAFCLLGGNFFWKWTPLREIDFLMSQAIYWRHITLSNWYLIPNVLSIKKGQTTKKGNIFLKTKKHSISQFLLCQIWSRITLL